MLRKLGPFDYIRPRTLDEAAAALEPGTAAILAGGTDLLLYMKQRQVVPETVVDLTALEQLQGITQEGNHITVGACVSHAEIHTSPLIRTGANFLAEAAGQIGGPQIRNMGTIGGNIGNASPAGDTLPPLYALDANVNLYSASGRRMLPIREFITGVGQKQIQQGEFIESISFETLPEEVRSCFIRIVQRKSLAIAKVSVALALQIRDGIIKDVRIAFGAVAPTIIRAEKTEAYLMGQKLTDKRISGAADKAAQEVSPITDIRSNAVYRRHMVTVNLKRAITRLSS